MLSHWPIRNKLLLGLVLLLAIVSLLSWNGLHGLYGFRGLLKDLGRLAELPLATELNQRVSDLRVVALSCPRNAIAIDAQAPSVTRQLVNQDFREKLDEVRRLVNGYHTRIQLNQERDSRFSDSEQEQRIAGRIEDTLDRVDDLTRSDNWVANPGDVADVDADLQQLQRLASLIPAELQAGIRQFPDAVRDQYRHRIGVAWATSGATVVLLFLFVAHYYKWIFRPLRLLIKGSRKVAQGNFQHRIRLHTRDEMALLAAAMNRMTERFQSVRDDLDDQVQQRTREVVRNEQLASVGFLAAGVAHDINNPLKAIAECAETIRRTLEEPSDSQQQQAEVLKHLGTIQTQAFCCKEITTNLLDMSRLGEGRRENIDLRELIESVIELVSHVGQHQSKRVELLPGDSVVAAVNVQETKQLVLSLVSSALNNIDSGGTVQVQLQRDGLWAQLTVRDDGPGMTASQRRRIFQPCGANEDEGEGVGGGLAISACIVEDHGGRIIAGSDGPGCGTQFQVWLPRAATSNTTQGNTKENYNHHQAA